MPEPRPVRATPEAARRRPDANPLRLMVGFAGVASATAIASALVAPAAAVPADPAALDAAAAAVPAPSVIHVQRIVQLQPGQTAPPQASVVIPPAPTPRVHVVTTRQSGTKP